MPEQKPDNKKRKNHDVTQVVSDLSKHAQVVDAKRLKGRVKVITRDDIRALIKSVIDSHKGLSNKDLLAKISEYQLQLKQLGDARNSMKQKLDAANAEIQKLNAQLEDALKNEDLQAQINQLLRELEMERNNSMAKDGDIENLEKKLKDALDMLSSSRAQMESKDSRIAELEELATQDGLSAKVAELQKKLREMEEMYEAHIKTLKEYIWEMEIGLEFVDVFPNVKRKEMTDNAGETLDLMKRAEVACMSGPESLSNLGSVFGKLRKRISGIELDFERADKLVETMEKGDGSIKVVNEIENINVRNHCILEDLERTNKVLDALCSVISA